MRWRKARRHSARCLMCLVTGGDGCYQCLCCSRGVTPPPLWTPPPWRRWRRPTPSCPGLWWAGTRPGWWSCGGRATCTSTAAAASRSHPAARGEGFHPSNNYSLLCVNDNCDWRPSSIWYICNSVLCIVYLKPKMLFTTNCATQRCFPY